MRRKQTSITEIFFLCLGFVFLLSFPSDALADYSDSNAGKKLLRGLINISTGWIEIFQGIYDVSSEKGLVTGALLGPIVGVGMAVTRTGSGLYETATFPLPFPAHYQATLQPEFVWHHWSLFGGLESLTPAKNQPDPP